MRAAEQIVEDHQAVGDHHDGVGQAQRIGRRPWQPLDGADHVVADVPDGAAGEAGQPRDFDGRQGAQLLREVADGVGGLPRARPAGAPGPALDLGPTVPPHLARLCSQKRVAGPALATHQRLEQERKGRARHFGQRGDGRVGVEHHLAHQRHHPAVPGPAHEVGARIRHLDFGAMRRLQLVAYAALAMAPGIARPGAAQAWNTDSGVALARRGIERRRTVASDTALRDYKAQAHGFVFFSGSSARAGSAAAPGKGRPAGAGSVLEGPGHEQATHRRLARPGGAAHRHRLPSRPSRHRAE